MEVLTSLTSQLKEKLLDVNDYKTKEDYIFKHLQNIEKENYNVDDFPPGLDWFNTSKPLSKCLLEGKIVVLDFFTYCCINCLHIIPHLRELEENFSVADGLVVIGVHSAKFSNEKDSKNILSALKRYNISHPVVNDRDCFLWNRLDISCWPTILILGPQRQGLFVLVGEGHRDELLLFVKVALKYYKNSISSHQLPLLNCDQIVTSSLLSFPGKVTRWKDVLAISDSGNHRILVIDIDGNIKFKIGGKTPGFKDGSFETARFNSPQGLVFFDSNTVYIADTENHAIRVAKLDSQVVETVVGNGIQGTDYVGGKTGILQEISSPWDVCIVPCSCIEVNSNHNTSNVVNSVLSAGPIPPPPPLLPSSSVSSSFSVSSTPPPPPLPPPSLLSKAVSSPPPPPPPTLLADLKNVPKPPPPPPPLTNLKNVPIPPPPPPSSLLSKGVSQPPPPPPLTPLTDLKNVSIPPPPPPPLTNSKNAPIPPPPPSVQLNLSSNNTLTPSEKYITNSVNFNTPSSKVLLIAAAGTHQIWAYFIGDGVWWKGKKYSQNVCVAIAGSGKEENRNNRYPMMASFAQPSGLTYSEDLKAVFIADSESSSIRRLNLKDGSVVHVAGGSRSPDDLFSYGDHNGKPYEAKFQHPLGVAWSSKENCLYVCDTYNHKIKKIDSSGLCHNIHDTGNHFNEPSGCCLNEAQDILFIADTNNNCLKAVSLADLTVKKVDIKEPNLNIKKTPSKDVWEAEVFLNKSGGNINLKVTFLPEEIHGKWKLDLDNFQIKTEHFKGKLETNIFNLSLVALPSDEDTSFDVFFDLVLCGGDTCSFKKTVLRVYVRRKDDSEKCVVCSVEKSFM